MSLPGITGGQHGTVTQIRVEIPPENEWRVEVVFQSKLTLRLLEGTAEVFGTELARGQEYHFSGTKFSVFSWKGCVVEYSGHASEYLSGNSPMPVYLNLHFALEAQRAGAENNLNKTPSILILGPENSGKSSLAKVLASYAAKMNRTPMVVNLDPRAAVFSLPGSLGASPVSDILDVESGWGQSALNGPSIIRAGQPLVYYYGLPDPAQNAAFYRHTASELGIGVISRLGNDEKVRYSGVIIDTPAEISNSIDGLDIVQRVVSDFAVTIITVIGDERLYAEIDKKFTEKGIKVLRLAKPGGVAAMDASWKRQGDRKSIQEYFYGSKRQPLSPYTTTVRFSDLYVYKVKDTNSQGSDSYLEKVEPSSILEHAILAVSNADIGDSPSEIAESEILGFVHVTSVDENRKFASVLLPLPGRLPQKPLILGDFKYNE